MKRSLRVVLTACLVLAAGCGPSITKRYSGLVEAPHYKPQVKVSTFVNQVTGFSYPAVLQLSAEGQAALITALANADGSTQGLLGNLAKGLGPSGSGSENRTSRTVRVVYSVSSDVQRKARADRINYLQVNLTGLPPSLGFTKWNRFESEYGTMDLGKLSVSKSVGASAGITPDLMSTVLGKASGTASVSQTMAEELSMSRRFLITSGILKPDSATIFHEGAAHIDLKGNYSVDLTLAFKPNACELRKVVSFAGSFWETDKGESRKKPKPQERAAYGRASIKMPKQEVVDRLITGGGVKCKLSGAFEVRHVVSGDATNHEGDDEVAFVQGSLDFSDNELTLLSCSQVESLRLLYFIYQLGDDSRTELSVNHPGVSEFMPMYFASYGQAHAFLEWLTASKATKVFHRELGFRPNHLSKGFDYDRLTIGAFGLDGPKCGASQNAQGSAKVSGAARAAGR